MDEAINTKERDEAVVLVRVVRMKLDANVAINVVNGRRWVERLGGRGGKEGGKVKPLKKKELKTTHLFPNIPLRRPQRTSLQH